MVKQLEELEERMGMAHVTKKRRVVRSEQTEVDAQRMKLLRVTKPLVEARQDVIAAKIRLGDDLRKIHDLLSELHLGGVPAGEANSAERGEDVEKGDDVEGSSDDSSEYEIREIVDSAIRKRRTPPGLYYRVRWAGFEDTKHEYTWVSAADMTNAEIAIKDFHARHPNKPRP